MANRGKTRPDHYQVEGGIGMDPDRYPQEVQKLKDHEAPFLAARHPGVGSVVHAGELLGQSVVAVCTECEVEIGVSGGVPILPCENCGCSNFRVVS